MTYKNSCSRHAGLDPASRKLYLDSPVKPGNDSLYFFTQKNVMREKLINLCGLLAKPIRDRHSLSHMTTPIGRGFQRIIKWFYIKDGCKLCSIQFRSMIGMRLFSGAIYFCDRSPKGKNTEKEVLPEFIQSLSLLQSLH